MNVFGLGYVDDTTVFVSSALLLTLTLLPELLTPSSRLGSIAYINDVVVVKMQRL